MEHNLNWLAILLIIVTVSVLNGGAVEVRMCAVLFICLS